ncbi:hypothetical protein D3C80_1246050 [compost metagenome]
MNLREALIQEHSKAQKDEIVNWIGNSESRFNELFTLFMNEEHRLVQCAAWPLSDCVINHPAFIHDKYDELIVMLKKKDVHDAVKRNITRILQQVDIPEDYCGDIMNLAVDFVSSPKEAVAIKVFSLTILQNIAQKYPEIVPEIRLIIADQFEHQTPGFKSRATKFLKAFK